MKKLVLPTLISLVLSSPGILAEETSTSETEANLPAEEATSEAASPAEEVTSLPSPAEEATSPEQTQPSDSTKTSQNMRDKWIAHRKSMQEQLKKLHETDDQEERQRLWKEMQKSRHEMHEMMMESGGMPGPRWGGPGPGWGGPGWGGPGPGWGGPGPGWGGPGPGWGGPGRSAPRWNDDNDRGHGFHNGPFNRMPSDSGGRPGWAKPPVSLQERLENIETLLRQIVDSLPKKDHDDDD